MLLTLIDRQPLIAYVVTAADHKQRGLARTVTTAALRGLQRAGYAEVSLFITAGNTPSERLFTGLGARPVAEG